MAKVRVLETSYIGHRIVEPGEVLDDYEGEIGPNLELIRPSKKAVPNGVTETPKDDPDLT